MKIKKIGLIQQKVFLTHLGSKREAPDAGEIFVQKDLLATLQKLVESETGRP